MLNKGKEPLEIRGITAETEEKSKHYPGKVTTPKARRAAPSSTQNIKNPHQFEARSASIMPKMKPKL
jgi:hypothetical protein